MALWDLLATWGPYAPYLLYAWLGLAFGYGYARTGAHGGRGRRPGLLLVGAYLLLAHLFLTQIGTRASYPGGTLMEIGFLAYPLLLSGGVLGRWPWRGYRRVQNVLLFRPSTPDGTILAGPPRRSPQAALGIVALASLGTELGLLGNQLQPCRPLDMTVGRTGCQAEIRTPSGFTQLAYSPDGTTLAVGDAHGTLLLWDSATAQPRRTLTETTWIDALAVAPRRAGDRHGPAR